MNRNKITDDEWALIGCALNHYSKCPFANESMDAFDLLKILKDKKQKG